MKKRLTALVLILCMICTTQMAFAIGIEYTPGPKTMEFTFENPLNLSNATVDGTNLILISGGSAEYDLLLRANQVKATISYTAASDTNLTLDVDSEIYTTALSSEEDTKSIDIKLRKGSHILTVSADKDITINKITFSKEPDQTGMDNLTVVEYDEYGEALQTTVVVKTDAVGIKVKGAMRYVDYDNPSLVPLCENGKIYLPIKTAARAFSLYYEDYADLNYAYMSNDNFEYYCGPGGEYTILNGKKSDAPGFVLRRNGTTWIPVRQLAEILGFTVGYKDGYAIIDDRICVKNIMGTESIMSSLKAEFQGFETANKVSGTTYHVSKAAYASDANDGSEDFPFATINHAAQVAVAGDTVIIHEGTYREEVVPKNDGTAANPIVFRAAEGEKVTISAFEEVSGFVPYKDGIYQTVLPKSLGLDRNFIIFKDEILREGRHPNTDTTPSEVNWPHPDYNDDVMRATMGNIRIESGNSEAVSTTDLNQPEGYWKGGTFVTLCGWAWTLSYARITDSQPGKISLQDHGGTGYGITYYAEKLPYDYGFITNHINTIDMPGEWYVNDEGILYLMPPKCANPQTMTVEAKQRQRVVDLTDRKYIQFVDINTRGGGLTMAGDSEMCVLNGGTHKYISQVGWSAADNTHNLRFYDKPNQNKGVADAPEFGEVGFFAHGSNNAFINTTIDYSAGAGIYLTGRYAYIENNLVSHTAYAGTYPGGITLEGIKGDDITTPWGGHTVVGNTSYGAGRATFYVSRNYSAPDADGKRWILPYMACDIGYNHFYYSNITSRDTGIVYFYGITAGNDWSRTQLHHNVIHDNLTNDQGTLQTGFYHDGHTAMFDTYSNIVWTTHDGYLSDDGVKIQGSNYCANVNAWANSKMGIYTGGIDGLATSDYPYSRPFSAGATREDSKRFMKNYERLGDNGKILVDKADKTGNAYIDEDGYGRLTEDTDSFVFKNIDMNSSGTRMEMYFSTDRHNYDWNNIPTLRLKLKSGDTVVEEIKRELYLQGEYLDSVMKETFFFKGTDLDTADIEVSLEGNVENIGLVNIITSKCNYDEEVEKLMFAPDATVVYMGSFDQVVSGNGGTGIFHSNEEESVTGGKQNRINNTNNNVYLFKDIEFLKDINKFSMRVGSSRYYSATTVEIRVDSLKSEPIASIDMYEQFTDPTIFEHAWLNWQFKFDLEKTIPAGKHDIYVSYVPQEGRPNQQSATGTTDSYFMTFN